MADVKDYVQALMPTWLLGPMGEALTLVYGLIADAHAEGTREAVALRFVDFAPLDSLDDHGSDREILRAPGEGLEAFRARLMQAWDAWAQAGSPGGILLQLGPAGVAAAVLVEGASIDPEIPASWGRWYLDVSEPHPFTPPVVWGGGQEWGDGWLWGFGDATALEYVRRVIRKWEPARTLCTGIRIEFSSPATFVRLPV